MFLSQNPQTIDLLREKYLLYTFHRNAERIPLYKNFLKKRKINHKKIRTVADFLEKVPETNKQNYIFRTNDISKLCINGDYHKINLLVKSSGHSGKQCYWAKSHTIDPFGEAVLTIGLDENFDISSRKTLIINGFILGSWVTGITFNEFASSHCPIINVGPNCQEIIQTIRDVGHQFEQILITGYPPFIKELVDYGNSTGFPWKKYKMNFAAGGEDFPESWRDYIRGKSGALKIRSGFGASDIGILGGVETDTTVAIRRLADKDHRIKKELFGDVEDTPMLFQYPTNLFIHANDKKELVFTTILPEAVQPVIKYNLKDSGGVITHKEMQEKLHKLKIKQKIKLPLPFLYIIGRSDGPVNFHAFLVYPENIVNCIYKDKKIAKVSTGNFRLKKGLAKNHEPILIIELQLKKNAKKTVSMEKEFSKSFAATLKKVNGGYEATANRIGKKAFPKIKIYKFNDYPYKSKIKNVYS